MGTTDISLQRIFQQLIRGNVGTAIAETEIYLEAWPNQQTKEKLMTLKGDYRLMVDYWKQGMKDPQLEQQYQRLLQRLYVLCANISIHRHMTGSSYLKSLYTSVRSAGRQWSIASIRNEMESFVSEVAMLEFEPEHTRKDKSRELYKQHHQQMNQLFCFVLTSHIWTDSIAADMEELLVSPTVDSIDQQLLTTAVMLSLMNRFDMAKFRLLVNVYSRSHDENVRQRSLVGWVLSIDDDYLQVYPEQRELIATLLKSKRVCRELTELQIQLVYTMNAEKDTATMSQEIMPDILQTNGSFRITKNGIEEAEDDPLEDILHPNASEERLNKLESSLQRMMDMQKQGADLYFGGFSQMKRYPFFYDISNWLVPFYMQHPDIEQFLGVVAESNYLQRIVKNGPFCNSDKYSFLIVFNNVIDSFSENIRNIMMNDSIPMDEIETEDQQSALYIRRIYLMDLYRFFRLFPNRSALCNPFDTSSHNQLGMCLFFTSDLFRGTPLEAYKRDVVAMFRKRKMMYEADLLLETFPEEMRDVQYYLWMNNFDEVLKLEPDNEKALAGRAREYFQSGMFDEADEAYERLLLLNPGKVSYMLNKAVCLVNMEDYEEALRLLYQLNYEHEDDANVQRVLAWTLTCDGKLEQAEKIFQQLTGSRQASGEDYMNYAYCQWLQGHIEDAADSFNKYLEQEGNTWDNLEAAFNREWLNERGINETNIRMMQALILNSGIILSSSDSVPF